MIRIKPPVQKPTVISPQIQKPFRINQPETDTKLNIPPAPRKYKKSKAIQTDKSELINENCENQEVPNFDGILEKLKLKQDNTKSVRFKINLQQQKNAKNNRTSPIKQEQKSEISNESVTLIPFIEFDMHGGDYHISEPFDWIQIIREILIEAQKHQIDMIKFIPGQGKHTNLSLKEIKKPKDPILRPLTLVATKMLNYNSYIDINNRGVVICPIPKIGEISEVTNAQIENERRELIFNVFLGISSFDLQNEKLVDLKDEKYEEKIKIIKTFKEVKKEVPELLDSCIEIISIWKKETKDALEFAQTFMKKFNVNETNSKRKKLLKRAKMKDDKKKDDEMTNIMKLVNKFQQKYGFDRNIIQRIAEEQRTEEKCEKVLDKIYHDMVLPYIFLRNNFSNIITENETIPVVSLLETFKECEYIPQMVQNKMCSQSYKNIGNALRVMKVSTNIDSRRSFNEFFNQQKIDIPKFVPSIEVNLENAGVEKAISSIGRVMDGLSIGEFCEMILIFAQEPNKIRCTIENVRPFIQQKAKNDGYRIFEKENRSITEYHFYIINNRDIKDSIADNSNSNE